MGGNLIPLAIEDLKKNLRINKKFMVHKWGKEEPTNFTRVTNEVLNKCRSKNMFQDREANIYYKDVKSPHIN